MTCRCFRKKGFSLARFGIGEITYLTNKASAILVQQFEHYKSYAGMTCSLDEMRRQLIQALKSTDIAGLIPASRLDFWGGNYPGRSARPSVHAS
ncbi:hypothetical protein GCM10020331_053130 [Ectobacillus funiculus]